jgi:hypothetical protein
MLGMLKDLALGALTKRGAFVRSGTAKTFCQAGQNAPGVNVPA